MKTKFEVRECLAFGYVTYYYNGTVEETIQHIKDEWQDDLAQGYDFIVRNEDGSLAFATENAFTDSVSGYM